MKDELLREPNYSSQPSKTTKRVFHRSGFHSFTRGMGLTLVYLALFVLACALMFSLTLGAIFLGECSRLIFEYVPGETATAKTLLILKEAAHVFTMLAE